MSSEGRRYRILGVLGRGGFGTVYRAELLGEGKFVRQVALKVMNPNLEAQGEVARRMRDEARMLGMLRHRAIVQVDGLVRLDDRWTVVMEYIDGIDLHAFRPNSIPVGPALEIVAEVATALNIAYETLGPDDKPLKLVHRDIKPSNLLLTSAGEVKVLDFGIARANFDAREAATRSMVFGSPGYIAPERMDFIDGPAGDVYSLGVVLFELVTGEAFGKAFAQPDRHAGLVAHAVERLRARMLPESLVDLVNRMTNYHGEQRPSAREVESACRDLRGPLGAPWLRDWAEAEVPPMLLNRGLTGNHDFSTSLLSERGSAPVLSKSGPGFSFAQATDEVERFDEPPPSDRAAVTFPPPDPREAKAPTESQQIGQRVTEALLTWAATALPGVQWCGPADELEVSETEAVLGKAIPPALRRLYLRHDGQVASQRGAWNLFEEFRFLPLADAIDTWRAALQAAEGMARDFPSKGVVYKPVWLPFGLAANGARLCVDLESLAVFEVHEYLAIGRKLGASPDEFITEYLRSFERGDRVIDPLTGPRLRLAPTTSRPQVGGERWIYVASVAAIFLVAQALFVAWYELRHGSP
jgi:serine/threonine protein kinase